MIVLALSACAFPSADAEESPETIAGTEELKGKESEGGDSEAAEEERTTAQQGTENEDAHSYNEAADVPKEIRSEEEGIRAQQLLLFGSTCTTWSCFFDEQGRIAYEDSYITHGSYDTYYIYMDDTNEPAYILNLDNCMGEWIPEFQKGK